jgi:hypothetical protein
VNKVGQMAGKFVLLKVDMAKYVADKLLVVCKLRYLSVANFVLVVMVANLKVCMHNSSVNSFVVQHQ